MGCKKYKIQDYFILRNSQNEVDTYTYDYITGKQSPPETDQQLLLCIQNILRILFQICDLHTKYKFLDIATYTYAPSSLRSKSSSCKQCEGRISAKFIYPPFSKLKPSVTAVNEVNFRFSTEYLNQETELVYYGYRYYDPNIGRWLSRDPIAESGGNNLYGFVGNDGINRWDRLGLEIYIPDPFQLDKKYTAITTESIALGITLQNGNSEHKGITEIADTGEVLFYASMTTTASLVDDNFFKPSTLLGSNNVKLESFNVKCLGNDNVAVPRPPGKLRLSPISIELKMSGKINVVRSGGVHIKKHYTTKYIKRHEFGHSDYAWSQFAVKMYYIQNHFNYNRKNWFVWEGSSIAVSENMCCKDLKRKIMAEYREIMRIINDKNFNHDKWNFYGRNTDSYIGVP